MSIADGSLVKVVKVIDVRDQERNAAKHSIVGRLFRTLKKGSSFVAYAEHVYELSVTEPVAPEVTFLHRYLFHADELEVVEEPIRVEEEKVIPDGTLVKVVKVLDVGNQERVAAKSFAIGRFFCTHRLDSPAYAGHVYKLTTIGFKDSDFHVDQLKLNQYFFHADELQLMTAVPQVGSSVRLKGSEDVVCVQSIMCVATTVVGENGAVGQVSEILSAEEVEEHKRQLAIAEEKKRTEEKAAMEKKRAEWIVVAQNAMLEAMALSEKLKN